MWLRLFCISSAIFLLKIYTNFIDSHRSRFLSFFLERFGRMMHRPRNTTMNLAERHTYLDDIISVISEEVTSVLNVQIYLTVKHRIFVARNDVKYAEEIDVHFTRASAPTAKSFLGRLDHRASRAISFAVASTLPCAHRITIQGAFHRSR